MARKAPSKSLQPEKANPPPRLLSPDTLQKQDFQIQAAVYRPPDSF